MLDAQEHDYIADPLGTLVYGMGLSSIRVAACMQPNYVGWHSSEQAGGCAPVLIMHTHTLGSSRTGAGRRDQGGGGVGGGA